MYTTVIFTFKRIKKLQSNDSNKGENGYLYVLYFTCRKQKGTRNKKREKTRSHARVYNIILKTITTTTAVVQQTRTVFESQLLSVEIKPRIITKSDPGELLSDLKS